MGPSSDRWLRGSDLRLSRRTPTLLRIDELAQEIRRKTGAELAVVTVKRIKGAAEDRQEIKRFTTDARLNRICSHFCAQRQPEAPRVSSQNLFNLWGLGDRRPGLHL